MSIRGVLLFLILAAVSLAALPARAQDGAVRGTVLEEGFGDPLPGVSVFLEETRQGDATGPDGTFVVDAVAPGRYTLVARALGYTPLRLPVEVQAGEETVVEMTLAENPVELGEIVVERVMLTGGRRGLDDVPGSAYYVTPRQLERFSYNDAHRALREVPGVYVQEEDGYGLRPNIGLRGTGVERSSKITVMEDGVLIAPAPYAAPAAYYFPTVGRMQGIEVRKGSSQIKYGPYTTGGALNLISTQIPTEFGGYAEVLAGGEDARTLHAHLGSSFTHGGFLVETYQARSDGFKVLDGGGETGFDKSDVLAKLRLNTGPDARVYQALSIKAGRTTELSDETYLGLTETDFDATPFRRYAGSQQDVMDTEHRQLQLRHVIRPARFFDLTTTLYRTEFARNWYKLDKVRGGGERVSISDLLADPTAYADAFAVVTGRTSEEGEGLEVKANNREYYAMGAETIAGFQFTGRGLEHDLELGVRLHEDAMDRFQWVDLYRMEEGVMQRIEAGEPGTESNRIETARAVAAFTQYRLSAGRLMLTPGLRYEHVRITREDYGKDDPARTGADLATRANTVGVWIPGLGADYRFSEAVSAFAGIHKGFAPPGSKEGTAPEESINYELGVRYRAPGLRAQGVVFFNDYSNLLGADLAAAGGQGSTDQFNGGAVDVRGLELSLAYDLGLAARTRVSLPLTAAYTFTDATFQNGFESEFDPWGTVSAGDALPYLPRHQLAAGLGVEASRIHLHAGARYVSRVRTKAGQGAFEDGAHLASHLVFDLAGTFDVTRQVAVFATVRNLTDEVYAVARRPAGLRPGLPRQALLGLKARF